MNSNNERLAFPIQWIKEHSSELAAASHGKARATYLKHREASKKRLQSNPIARLALNLRGRIRSLMLGRNKHSKTIALLGCSVAELRAHMESQWVAGMSWENYGAWCIDHIKPCSAFDLTKPEEIAKCFHYSNMQPLWKADNSRKSSHCNGVHYSKRWKDLERLDCE